MSALDDANSVQRRNAIDIKNTHHNKRTNEQHKAKKLQHSIVKIKTGKL